VEKKGRFLTESLGRIEYRSDVEWSKKCDKKAPSFHKGEMKDESLSGCFTVVSEEGESEGEDSQNEEPSGLCHLPRSGTPPLTKFSKGRKLTAGEKLQTRETRAYHDFFRQRGRRETSVQKWQKRKPIPKFKRSFREAILAASSAWETTNLLS